MPTFPKRFIEARPSFYFMTGLVILLIPINYIVSWLVASFVHELFHYVTLRVLKVQIYGIHLSLWGAEIETEPITAKKEAVCALAGPMGSFLLVFFYRFTPIIALFGLLQTIFNLVPLKHRDGGRVLCCILKILIGAEKGSRVYLKIDFILRFALCIGFMVLWIKTKLSAFLLILYLGLLVGKFPCKLKQLIVQYQKQIPKRQDHYEESTGTHFTHRSKTGTVYRR